MSEQEKQVMAIIAGSGDSKAKAFAALQKVKENKYEEAKDLLKQSREADIVAHQTQTNLIQAQFQEDVESPIVNLLMVHAQDHYMCAQLARDLIEMLVDVFEAKEEK